MGGTGNVLGQQDLMIPAEFIQWAAGECTFSLSQDSAGRLDGKTNRHNPDIQQQQLLASIPGGSSTPTNSETESTAASDPTYGTASPPPPPLQQQHIPLLEAFPPIQPQHQEYNSLYPPLQPYLFDPQFNPPLNAQLNTQFDTQLDQQFNPQFNPQFDLQLNPQFGVQFPIPPVLQPPQPPVQPPEPQPQHNPALPQLPDPHYVPPPGDDPLATLQWLRSQVFRTNIGQQLEDQDRALRRLRESVAKANGGLFQQPIQPLLPAPLLQPGQNHNQQLPGPPLYTYEADHNLIRPDANHVDASEKYFHLLSRLQESTWRNEVAVELVAQRQQLETLAQQFQALMAEVERDRPLVQLLREADAQAKQQLDGQPAQQAEQQVYQLEGVISLPGELPTSVFYTDFRGQWITGPCAWTKL